MNRPRLVDGARLQYDDVRDEHLLLIPEGAVRLNATAAQVLELCDGERSARRHRRGAVGALRRRRRAPTTCASCSTAWTQKGLVVDAGA